MADGKPQSTAYRIQEAAYAAFDLWLEVQPDEVRDMTLLEQIEVYAHER